MNRQHENERVEDGIVIDYTSLQYARRALGCSPTGVLDRKPLPAKPSIEPFQLHSLRRRLTTILSEPSEKVFSRFELTYLGRCATWSMSEDQSEALTSWRSLFEHLEKMAPASAEECRATVARYLAPILIENIAHLEALLSGAAAIRIPVDAEDIECRRSLLGELMEFVKT